jgi:hypothetical protein
VEQEEDVLAVSELVEDLWDVLLGYQVSGNPKNLTWCKAVETGMLG